MIVVVEPKPNCVATLHVELPPDKVTNEWQNVAREFQKFAKVAGYRPGKAPQALVNKKFAPQIKEELTNKLLRTAMNDAIREKQLRVLTVSKVDRVEIAPDNTMRFTATVVTSPDFELPDYSKIELAIEKRELTDEDVDRALNKLAEQYAEFEIASDRPLQMGDFAVVSYAASIDGKPMLEAFPAAPQLLAGRPNWWVRMAPGTLVAGFCEAIDGMQPGETREFEVDVPQDFAIAELRGKTLSYTATLHEVRQRILPPHDDALAEKIEAGKTIAEIRERLRQQLESYRMEEFEHRKREGAVKQLLAAVQCDLPAQLVQNEMSGILREIVQENQVRGVSDEELKSHSGEIMGAAHQSATDRVRSQFILMRIAEKENLRVTEDELVGHVAQLASRYQIPVQKMFKDLERRNGFDALREHILIGKALDFVTRNVTVRHPQSGPSTNA